MSDFANILSFHRQGSIKVGNISSNSNLAKNLRYDEMLALSFLTIEKPIHLLRILKRRSDISFYELERIINNPEYHCYTIPKKRGGLREIQAPVGTLKQILQQINGLMQIYYDEIKPECVHGFVIKPSQDEQYCNIVANAQPHVNKRFVLNMDIKDFFPGITAKRVYKMFLSDVFGFNKHIAVALTLLTTYRGQLPTGSPSSPVISNFICLDLDRDLTAYCCMAGLTYTRYADDLTFSSDIRITAKMIYDIRQIIQRHDFRINENKFRLLTAHAQQKVTGLVVNKKVNIDRRMLKRIRAMLHDLNTNGLHAAALRHFGIQRNRNLDDVSLMFLKRLDGYINFVGQVRGKDHLYDKMEMEFSRYTDSSPFYCGFRHIYNDL